RGPAALETAAPDADAGDGDDRDSRAGPDPDDHQRHAPEEHPDREIRAQPLAADEQERQSDPYEPAHAVGGVEIADPGLADAEQLQGRDEYEDSERSCDERLCAVEADEEPELPIAEDGAESGQRLAGQPELGGGWRLRPGVDRKDGKEQAGKEERDRGRGEHGLDVRRRE